MNGTYGSVSQRYSVTQCSTVPRRHPSNDTFSAADAIFSEADFCSVIEVEDIHVFILNINDAETCVYASSFTLNVPIRHDDDNDRRSSDFIGMRVIDRQFYGWDICRT